MTPTQALDALFAAAVFDMDTPELGLPGEAIQLRHDGPVGPAGPILATVILTTDPTLTKTPTRDNGGVPLGGDDALHLVTHRMTIVDTQTLRRDCILEDGVWIAPPQPAGEKGILADLSSTCYSYQPQDGIYPLPGSYLHGEYQEAPVVKDGAVVGSAYYTLDLVIITDNDADHPGAERWFYTAGPGDPGQRGGHVPRVGIGKGIFAYGQTDPGEGNLAFDVAYLTAAEVSMVRFRTFKPQDLPNPRTIGPALCFFDEGRGRGPEPIYSSGRRWNRLKVE